MKRIYKIDWFNDEFVANAVNSLLMIVSVLLIAALMQVINKDEPISKDLPKYEVMILKDIESVPTKREPYLSIDPLYKMRNAFNYIDIHYTTIEYEYLGVYFITAYCPEECGYRVYSDGSDNYPAGWTTASGEICHYSDEWFEPTTCAIDCSYHGFGEYLCVGNPDDPDKKIYVTEDTGPGVRGAWIDCFVETMDEVYSWPTGYQEVWRVTYVDNVSTPEERMPFNEHFKYYFLDN